MNSGEEVEKLARQLNDLEAHLNTSIITEKSVRKAQDKQLAEEIDRISGQLAAKAGKDKAAEAADALEAQDQNTKIKGLGEDLGKQQEELKAV